MSSPVARASRGPKATVARANYLRGWSNQANRDSSRTSLSSTRRDTGTVTEAVCRSGQALARLPAPYGTTPCAEGHRAASGVRPELDPSHFLCQELDAANFILEFARTQAETA
jgi:hypothetical protein